MKRIVSLIMIIIFLLGLSACDLNPIVNKINGTESAVKAKQEKEKYTELEDGTYLYKQASISAEKTIQFIDEDGKVWLDSSDIMLVSAKWSEYDNYYIQLEFTEEGTADFANATRENKGKTISVVLNGETLLSPKVYGEVTSSSVVINNCGIYDEMISLFNKMVE